MQLLSSCSRADLEGKRALVRVDFNVPIENGRVVDDFRIRQALPSILFLQKQGASVRILSHIGRGGESLRPVYDVLAKELEVVFVESFEHDIVPTGQKQVFLFENLRKAEGEEACDDSFARMLARHGDIYVQDAFAVCHREHASITRIPEFLPSCAGLLLEKEIKHLNTARTPEPPSLAVLGGAKFETKEPLIRSFLQTHTHVFVGGALANELLLARGYAVGASRVEDGKVPSDILHHEKLIPITDVIVEQEDGTSRTCDVSQVRGGDVIVDIGPRTAETLAGIAARAHSVVWNGPLGWYERGYTEASTYLTEALLKNTNAHTVIGGGDTVALLEGRVLPEHVFVSTGGGAMLEYLLHGTLPGISVLSSA